MSEKHFGAKFDWGARVALTALALAGVIALAGCMPGLTGSSGEFELSGTVESVGSDALVVDGQTVALTPSTKMPKSIAVGDTVRLTLGRTDDGQSFALEIEVLEGVENGNQNLNENEDDEANENGAFNENEDNNNANEDDDDEDEFIGTLESIDLSQLTVVIDGKSYPLASNAEIKDSLQPGDLVKVHLMGLSDGTVVVREIEWADDDDDDNDNNNNNENAALNANEDDDDHDNNGNEAFNENEDDGDDHEGNENAALNANEDDDDHDNNGNEAFNENGDNGDDDDNGNYDDDDDDNDDDSSDHHDDDEGDHDDDDDDGGDHDDD